MNRLIDLDRYPLHQLESVAGQQLVRQCIDDLGRKGMFTLAGFLRTEVVDEILPDLLQRIESECFGSGTTHVIFEPLDFMARLAALVPKPRANLTRFHGVFAGVPHQPNSKYRAFMPCGYW